MAAQAWHQQALRGLGLGLGSALRIGVPDSDFCKNATYSHRLDDPATFNYCSVPGGAPDAFLFAALAVLVAGCLHVSSLSAVFVLVAGAVLEAFVFPFNLGRLGNAVTLWLGIDPPSLFFYAFLPLLLLDSALSIDFFLFNKVALQVMVFAFLVVLLSALLTTPVLLYGLGLAAHGWRWQHGALFSAMLASTDALAITAVLRRAGGPEALVTLMEGESLLNDASGIVLSELFHRLCQHLDDAGGDDPPVPTSPLAVLPLLADEIARLAAGGVLVGLAAGVLTRRLLRLLRWWGASASQEIAAIIAVGFLSFYIANAPLHVSGVIAVVAFGLYGNSTSHFELGSSRTMRESAAVQSTLSFSLNGVVFFFAGSSAVNFMIRAVESLGDYWRAFALFPPLYLALFAIRGLCILLFNPLFTLLGSQALPLRAAAFATWGGLRGAISLIMVQVVVTDERFVRHSPLVAAQLGLWTSLFVLSTLFINAPTIPAVLRFTGLTQLSPVKLRIREKAKRALLRYTAASIRDLKEDPDEMLRGVDWGKVAQYVDLSEELPLFGGGPGGTSTDGSGRDSAAGGGGGGGAEAMQQGAAAQEALRQQGELFEAAGWAAPSTPRGTASSRRVKALADLGRVSNRSPLSSSRRLLGASFATLSHKWEPRSMQQQGAPSEEASAADLTTEDGDSAELEAPLLSPTSAGTSPRGRSSAHLRRSSALTVGSSSGAEEDALPSRRGSVDRQLGKWGSSEFEAESPFWPASRKAGGRAGKAAQPRMAAAKSEPLLMHTIVEVGTSSEEESSDSEGWAATPGSQQPPSPRPEDSSFSPQPASEGLPALQLPPLQQPQPAQPLPQPMTQPRPEQPHFARLEFDTGLRAASDADFLLPDSTAGAAAGSTGSCTAGLPEGTAAAPTLASAAAGLQPPPGLLPLRVGRLSMPASPRAGVPPAGTMLPRAGGRALQSPAAAAAAAGSGPMSPRSMHGLVRTSLLPAAADRQAVQQVGELFSGEDDPMDSPGSVASGGSSSPGWPAPAVPGGAPAAAPLGMQLPLAGGSRGPSRLVQTSTADRRGFGFTRSGASGLAGLLRPPSPGKISPMVSSGCSPEPAEGLEAEEQAAEEHMEQQPPLPPLDSPAPAAGAEAEAETRGRRLAGSARPPPELGRSLSLDRHASVALLPSPFAQQQTRLQQAPQAHYEPHRQLSAAPLPLTTAPSAGSLKPWHAKATLLHRSMSTPLTGIAEQLELAGGGGSASEAGETLGGDGLGGLGPAASTTSSGGGGQWSEEVLAEARIRLVAGLKRYFHAKRGEGLLSSQGLRILDHACDCAIDCASQPLDIRSVAERETVGKYLVRTLAWLFFRTKRLTGRLPRPLRVLLMPSLRWLSGALGVVLSRTLLAACEVAVELWLGLTWSPQAQWLRESERAGQLQEELRAETNRVSSFIVDREIEAPERFQAIQSYRAAMAILRQQSAFVDELFGSGIVNEVERQAMQEPVERRARQLEIQGPVWRAPSVREVLRGLPFLQHVPEPLFDALLERGQLIEFARGDVVWAPPQEGRRDGRGLSIVIYGLLRQFFTDWAGRRRDYFLGSGGVVGLFGALTGQPMPGSGPALAEANALHKGPVVFHLPQSAIHRIRQRAAARDHDAAQLELDLFRVAGLYVVERLKAEVLASMAAEYQRWAVERARRQAIRAAAVAAAGAPPAPGAAAAEAAALQPSMRSPRVRFDVPEAEGEEEIRPPHGQRQKQGGAGPAGGGGSGRSMAYVPLTDAEVLQSLDRQQLWHASQAHARDVMAELRHQLRDAELLHLQPRQAWHQRNHAMLMHGSLHGGGGGSAVDLQAPAVLPWLRLAGGPGGRIQTAVGGGALLLVCPEEPASPGSASSSTGSLSDLGSPFASAGAGRDVGARRPEEQAGREAHAGVPPRLQPDGRPLHRVRSRRLPAAAALGIVDVPPS